MSMTEIEDRPCVPGSQNSQNSPSPPSPPSMPAPAARGDRAGASGSGAHRQSPDPQAASPVPVFRDWALI